MSDKPRTWSEKQLSGLVGLGKNVDLAPDDKRIVARERDIDHDHLHEGYEVLVTDIH